VCVCVCFQRDRLRSLFFLHLVSWHARVCANFFFPLIRRTGRNQNTLLIPMNDPVEKKWREGLGYVGIYPEMTQLVVKPILQPFVDGLWEPFDGFIGQFKSELFVYVAMSGVAGLLTGYFIGKAKRDR